MIDLEPPVTHGKIYCPQCCTMQWFVSWDEQHRGPEHAECRECGYCYGSAEETVVDPVTHQVSVVRRPILSPDVIEDARRRLRKDLIRDLASADISNGRPAGYAARKLGLSDGPFSTDR